MNTMLRIARWQACDASGAPARQRLSALELHPGPQQEFRYLVAHSPEVITVVRGQLPPGFAEERAATILGGLPTSADQRHPPTLVSVGEIPPEPGAKGLAGSKNQPGDAGQPTG